MRHTPAPWNMIKSKSMDNFYHIVRPEENGTLEICTISLADNSMEDHANAAMLVASIDLYNALRGLVAGIEAAAAAGIDTTGYIAVGKALAAIAKAEGREGKI